MEENQKSQTLIILSLSLSFYRERQHRFLRRLSLSFPLLFSGSFVAFPPFHSFSSQSHFSLSFLSRIGNSSFSLLLFVPVVPSLPLISTRSDLSAL
ncbi:hypothetical protein RIF29_38710 [Crotalaria pallida]|uniref:Transmembrane protein n=1 Tax=Crotalaria pallida TaxID=3830 RepID=A0AAN9E2B7_CROPI